MYIYVCIYEYICVCVCIKRERERVILHSPEESSLLISQANMDHLFLLAFNFHNHCWRLGGAHHTDDTIYLPCNLLKCMLPDFPVNLSMDLSPISQCIR